MDLFGGNKVSLSLLPNQTVDVSQLPKGLFFLVKEISTLVQLKSHRDTCVCLVFYRFVMNQSALERGQGYAR